MSSISQYLTDNANAGACAANYYDNTHDAAQCRVASGICSVIAFLVVELKNAEYKASLSTVPQYVSPPLVPVSPAPFIPVSPAPSGGSGSSAGSGGGGGGGTGSGFATWGNEGVEQRRS